MLLNDVLLIASNDAWLQQADVLLEGSDGICVVVRASLLFRVDKMSLLLLYLCSSLFCVFWQIFVYLTGSSRKRSTVP